MSLEIGVAIVVGFLIKEIASGALKEVGKEFIFKPVTNLLTPDELIQLNLFSDVPDSPSLHENATQILETRLNEYPQVVNQLTELIKQIPNVSTIVNKEITGNTEVKNIVKQTTGLTTSNESLITNEGIENSKVTNEVTQN